MHRIRLAILLFLCVSAAGCQPVPGVLLDAEAIVMEHPDSAARLLEGVPAPEKRLSRRNYAHYALVLTQARWLAGENMIDDTLSDVALDYYRTHTDDFAAAHKAYYYAAKIAHQRRQPEVAMTLLLKSRDMLPPKGEWRRHYVVETWLGVFCGQQHLFEEKIRHAQQAYAYADSMERYDWMCISLGDMAHAYMGLDNYDSMEYYAIKALRLAEEKGITENTSPKWAMLIESALKRKEYRKAEEYWEKGFGHAPAWTRYSWLSTKADICNRTGRYDTALELTDSSRRMCADTTHLTSRALWALNTSNAWEGKGDAARSLEALKQYIRLKDSIDEKVHSAEVLNIRKLWRYEQLKTQNAALQSQKQHRERIVYETILICAAHGWDCACGTAPNCGNSPSKSASCGWKTNSTPCGARRNTCARPFSASSTAVSSRRSGRAGRAGNAACRTKTGRRSSPMPTPYSTISRSVSAGNSRR